MNFISSIPERDHGAAHGKTTPSEPPIARIHLFGGFRIERDDWSAPVRFTRAAETVLSYLVIHRQGGHARDELAGRFWGDMPEDRARNCLNTTLWRIRRVLEPDAHSRGSFIETLPSGDVRFRPTCPCWIDVAVFKEAVDQLLAISPDRLSDDEVVRLSAAIDLYTSDILSGVFDDWALMEREHLRALRVNAQIHVMAAHRARGDLQRSLAWGRRVVAAEPLREEVHRQLIGLYCEAGQPAEAMRQYETCRTALRDNLGILPGPETQALRTRIDAPPEASLPTQNGADELALALDLLRRAAAALRDAEHRVGLALSAVEASADASRMACDRAAMRR